MAKYYKGKITLSKQLYREYLIFAYRESVVKDIYGIAKCTDESFLKLYSKLSNSDRNIIGEYFYSTKEGRKVCQDGYNILKEMLRYENIESVFDNDRELDIIFELICDENDNLYAKEIITGALFPLMNKYTINIDESIDGKCSFIVTDKSKYEYVKLANADGDKQETYVDQARKSYDLRISFLVEYATYYKLLSKTNRILIDLLSSREFKEGKQTSLKISYNLNHTNIGRMECFVENKGLANSIELDEYLKKYQSTSKIFLNSSKKRFRETVLDYSNRNCFLHDVTPKQEKKKELETQDKMTIVMENIEYMLTLLAKSNPSLSKTYTQEYNEILDNENTSLNIKPFDINTLRLLESKIELSLDLLKRNAGNILEYLDNLKKVYIETLFVNEVGKTDITLNEIDRMMGLFLKSKQAYNLKDQRKVLKGFALIYLFEVLENKENIDELELENSYFSSCLKTIIMHINALIELGIIKSNVIIELENDVNLESIKKIIQGLEIIKSKDKELVLKLNI